MNNIKDIIDSLNDSLKNLHVAFIDGVGNVYAVSEETIKKILALLKEYRKPDCEHAEHDRIGCLGYAGCIQDDEPINTCKECEKYTGNIYRMVEWNEQPRTSN